MGQQPLCRSTEQERRRVNIGGVMSYGGDNYGTITEDKMTDIVQLKDEVD